MSVLNIHQVTDEIDKNERKLTALLNKWDEDSALKSLSKHGQSIAVRAVVSAKRLVSVLIPKLKFKIDLSLRTPNDKRLLESASDGWNILQPKIESTLQDFEKLESGRKSDYPTKEQKQRDELTSKNIANYLKLKKNSGKVGSGLDDAHSLSSSFSEDGRGDMGSETNARAISPRSNNRVAGDSSEPSTNANYNGGYGKKLVENVREIKEKLLKGQEKERGLPKIQGDKGDMASVKSYIQSLTACETSREDRVLSHEMLDKVCGFGAGKVERRKAEREMRLAKSNEMREKRIQKIENLATIHPVLTRTSIPSTLPIDGFLDYVQNLPEEIQKLVTKEMEALSDYYKDPVFLKKKPLSTRGGTLINMNRLKKEFGDERFDARDFHMRVPESAIADEHLKKLNERVVDKPF